MSQWTLAFTPLVPWWVLGTLCALALPLILFGLVRRARGVGWRFAAMAVLAGALANPALVEEDREPQRDVAVMVIDESPSQQIGDRMRRTEAAQQAIAERARAIPNLDLRIVRTGAPADDADPAADEGTRLFGALAQAVSDVPRQRLAGAVLITDGQVHDVPEDADHPLFGMPVHTVLTGEREEGDRRLVVEQTPSFGLVGKTVRVVLKVEDLPGAAGGQGRVVIRKDGGQPQAHLVPLGTAHAIDLTLDHGGPTVFEIVADPGPRELTLDNNRTAFVVNGVRDRLRVLLVSGEPHPGERTWRNILKSDPSVDLVHFTILRPPEKQDGTPVRELSLIAFPIRELFDIKVNEFDLIIFDRYRRRGILPQLYLENIANYVRRGGGLLEAGGVVNNSALSLNRTPLGQVLPGEPTGIVHELGYKPRVTPMGERHPVTAELPGSEGSEPRWGRWFRQASMQARGGAVLMNGVGTDPLLILDRVGEGRVAQVSSDHIWLWARGFEGGGPQAELLRRLAYWLMKEPDLEEQDLRARVDGRRLVIERRALDPRDTPVQISPPNGPVRTVRLEDVGGGRQTVSVPIRESGLYTITDGERTALAAAGALNPRELTDVRSLPDLLRPVADATGGGIFHIARDGIPEPRRIRSGRTFAGSDWFGFRANADYVVTGIRDAALLPAIVVMLLALGALMLAWRREGR
ncbi:membrane protein [Allostella sp. ATCC 35155]|nr:membrane protein [Stella sp. ATCC 35155]